MARLFDDAQSEHLQINQVAVSGTPFAVVGFFNSNEPNEHQVFFWIGDKDTDAQFYEVMINKAADPYFNKVRAAVYTPSLWRQAQSSTSWSVDTWHHICAIYASLIDRRIFLDAGGKGTNTDGVIPVGLDRMAIGMDASTHQRQYMSGSIAEVAVYDLSVWPGANGSAKADNFEKILPSLAKGFTPICFPLGLKAYWPLVRGLNDKVGGYNLTASGTVVAAHPRIITPHSQL